MTNQEYLELQDLLRRFAAEMDTPVSANDQEKKARDHAYNEARYLVCVVNVWQRKGRLTTRG